MRLVIFDAIPIAIGIDGLQRAGSCRSRLLGEAGDAVGCGQRGDEIAGTVIGELRGDADDVGDLDEPVGGIVVEGGKAAEGVGDLGDLVDVGRMLVGKGGDLADGIGDGDHAKVGIVGQRDGVAGGVDQLGEKNLPRRCRWNRRIG